MCDFIAIASAGLGIMQSAVEYSGANDKFKAQMEAYNQNANNAAHATAQQYSNLGIRAQQEDAATNQQKSEAEREAAQSAASVEVAASEGGVSGLSVDAVLRDIYSRQGRNEATLDANQRMSRGYLSGELAAAEASGQSQINSMPIPEKPSAAPYILNAFGAGLSALSDYKKRIAGKP